MNYKSRDASLPQKVNYMGNNIKSMYLSVEDSLKKLRTAYIDIFYVHIVSFATFPERCLVLTAP